MATAQETREQLEERQESEEEVLEEKVRSHLAAVAASAGKGKKAKAAIDTAEREAEHWRYEMHERHREELDALEEREEAGVGAPTAAAVGDKKAAALQQKKEKAAAEAAAVAAAEEEADRVQRKRDKAQKKKQNKTQKEREKEEEREQEKRDAGPSAREVELGDLMVQLAKHKPPLKVSEVMGDGHCLYRSVADQLRRYRPDLQSWSATPDVPGYQELRQLCAKALRRRREDYEPFAELADGEDFLGYCSRIETSADWGGQLELRALADELPAEILVYRAGEREPLSLGKAGRGEVLHVTFHQYWYALGEHYNSAILQND